MTLHFAIIGCGSIATRHAEQIIGCGGKLVACCDIDAEKAALFGATFSIPFYTHLEKMLKEETSIEILTICTPNGLHAEHSIVALNHKKHVVCEKPMALTVKDCEKMISMASLQHRQLFMVMQNRFNPPVVELKKIIDQQLLGTISNVHLSCFWNRNNEYYNSSNWKGTKVLDGGILYTQFSHFIDILHWLFGDVKIVQATMGNFHHQGIIEIEDAGVVNIQFENNILCTINYSVNAYQKNYEGALTIVGEHGTVKVGGAYLNKMEYCCIRDYQPTILQEGNVENNYGAYTGSMSNHHLVYDNVVKVFNKEAAIATTGSEGLKTVALIERIYHSATWI